MDRVVYWQDVRVVRCQIGMMSDWEDVRVSDQQGLARYGNGKMSGRQYVRLGSCQIGSMPDRQDVRGREVRMAGRHISKTSEDDVGMARCWRVKMPGVSLARCLIGKMADWQDVGLVYVRLAGCGIGICQIGRCQDDRLTEVGLERGQISSGQDGKMSGL